MAAMTASAQKFALVDMEYILKNVPAYERANEQLNQVSKKWEGEVEALLQEVETMYKKYQSEAVFLSDTQKQKAEEDIMTKEKQASDLKKKYFGNEGELFKKRQSLMAPIQDEIPDGGRIIAQKAVEVQDGDTPEILQKRVMEQAEWILLPQAAEIVSKQLAGKNA